MESKLIERWREKKKTLQKWKVWGRNLRKVSRTLKKKRKEKKSESKKVL